MSNDIMARFLRTPFGTTATPEEIEQLRTREPLAHRKPTVALYNALLVHLRAPNKLTQAQLERIVEVNDEYRSEDGRGVPPEAGLN